MANRHAEVAPGQAARIAGSGYLAIFVLAIFANFFVRERLIDPGDAAAAGDLGTVRQLNPWHWYLDRTCSPKAPPPPRSWFRWPSAPSWPASPGPCLAGATCDRP